MRLFAAINLIFAMHLTCYALNVVFFEQMERDVSHWPAIIQLATKRIRRDQLLPNDVQLK